MEEEGGAAPAERPLMPLSLIWWLEQLLTMPDVNSDELMHLTSLVYEQAAAGGGGRADVPAPVTVRLYLRSMQPAFTPDADQRIDAASPDLFHSLGNISRLASTRAAEFAAGAARVAPPEQLLAAAAASSLAARVASGVDDAGVAPQASRVPALLEQLLEENQALDLLEDEDLRLGCAGGAPSSPAGALGARRAAREGAGGGAGIGGCCRGRAPPAPLAAGPVLGPCGRRVCGHTPRGSAAARR
jgi:hypothetical protein